MYICIYIYYTYIGTPGGTRRQGHEHGSQNGSWYEAIWIQHCNIHICIHIYIGTPRGACCQGHENGSQKGSWYKALRIQSQASQGMNIINICTLMIYIYK